MAIRVKASAGRRSDNLTTPLSCHENYRFNLIGIVKNSNFINYHRFFWLFLRKNECLLKIDRKLWNSINLTVAIKLIRHVERGMPLEIHVCGRGSEAAKPRPPKWIIHFCSLGLVLRVFEIKVRERRRQLDSLVVCVSTCINHWYILLQSSASKLISLKESAGRNSDNLTATISHHENYRINLIATVRNFENV